jgi:hypothetical protein
MSNFNFFGGISAFVLIAAACALVFAACSNSNTTEVVNSDNKWLKVDETMVHEIHPKPGVTCFVVYNNGISCIKD